MKRHSVTLLIQTYKKNALGQCPIYIRIIKDRKPVYISTGYAVPERVWDKKSEMVKESWPLSEQINLDITNKKKQVLQELINASVKGENISSRGVKELQQHKLNNIFSFVDHYVKTSAAKKAGGTTENYVKHMRKLEAFNGSRSLAFEEIDIAYLERFENWLRKGDNVQHRTGSDPSNYIGAILRTIRKMFNEARVRGLINVYPFAGFEMPKETPGNKSYLTLKELDVWHKFAFETEHPTLKPVAVFFLFACYTGLRLSDWKEFTEAKLKERNISLQATKNKVWVNVPLHERLRQTLLEMKKVNLTLTEPTINRRLRDIAKELKMEKKKFSSHSGRKTFAVTMCLERGISSETAAKLMGITLPVFVKSYSFITAEKIHNETEKAWKGL